MSEKTLNTRIVNKHDTEVNWNKATNFTPKQGEVIIYDKDSNHSYERMKIGDGVTKVTLLPFADKNDIKVNVNNTDYSIKDSKITLPSYPTKTSLGLQYVDNTADKNKSVAYATKAGSVSEANILWGGKNFSGSYGVLDAAMVPELGANRFAYLPPQGVTVEYSRDGGVTWNEYITTEDNKRKLFSSGNAGFYVNPDYANTPTTKDDQLCITVDTHLGHVYTQLNKFVLYISTNGSTGSTLTIKGAKAATPEEFKTFAENVPIGGWGGYNVINTPMITTYGNSPTIQYGKLKFIFKQNGNNYDKYSGLCITKILAFGGAGWTTPSNLAKYGTIYTADYNQNVIFPKEVKANKMIATSFEDKDGHTLVFNNDKRLGVITIKDRRSINDLPSYYFKNCCERVTAEMKYPHILGLPGVTFGTLVSYVNWPEDSGGPCYQVFYRKGLPIYTRTSIDSNTWSEWSKVYTEDFPPTKEEIGLDSVDNTPDIEKSVLHAKSADTLDGTLDASKLTGTIDIARLPQGALERITKVANQTERFKLTTEQVQLGDTVQQLDTKVMYIVSDTAHLNSEAGYTEYTAGAATSVPWTGVSGKPDIAVKATVNGSTYNSNKGTIALPSYPTKTSLNLDKVDNTSDKEKQLKASQVTFTDGKTFQQKLDDGSLKGEPGAPGKQGEQGLGGIPAGFGKPTATINATVGKPEVTVTATGDDTAKVFNFDFKNLKGEPGSAGPTGPQGPEGIAATIAVHSTSTLPEGSNAKVTNMGDSNTAKFKFEIPMGKTGPQGPTGQAGPDGFSPSASVSKLGTTTTITVTDKSGTTTAKVLDGAAGKQGPTGKQGDTGPQGPKGADGTSVTHSWSGTNLTLTSASGTTVTNLKGETGARGPQGEIGPEGPEGPIGPQGPAGATGPAGQNGSNGKSVTHSWSGSKLTLTSASGTTTTDLRGPAGPTGSTGPQGPTGGQGPRGESGVATQTSQPVDSSVNVWVNPNGRILNLMTESDLVGLATKDDVATVDERVTVLNNKVNNLKPDTSGLVKKTELLDLIYPVGSIYMNISEINPNSSLGGTWEKIAQGKTLFGDDGSTYKAGQSKEAGLPNITGRFDNLYGEAGRTSKYVGCCVSDPNKGHKDGWSSSWQNGTWGIDASKSNPIYGKSTTVQPPALVVCIWKRTA